LQFSNHFQTFLFTAEVYLALGYAVIPLYGDCDPTRPKVAAVAWAAYQKAKPSLDQCRDWFMNDGFAALGIVTGAVSRLAVLDFDTPSAYRDFQARFPALAETSVVQTRRGYHIYFRLPPNFSFPSRKGNGVDLLAEGSYVVARPSVIAGHTYQLVRGGQPYLLGLDALHQIQGFLDQQSPSTSPRSTRLEFHEKTSFTNPIPPNSPSFEPSALSPCFSALSTQHLVLPLYRYLAATGPGRNHALFCASLTARDSGYTVDQTIEALAPAHATQPRGCLHLSEAPAARQREAINTIRSAYSRPPRPLKIRILVSSGLPNTVRETLFRGKRTNVVRFWEGLRHKGIAPGQTFTADDAIALLKGIVGRDSIYTALKAANKEGHTLFETVSPSGHPQASNDAAADKDPETTKKMRFGRGEKQGINPQGRPKRHFIMPAPLDWCAKLGVKPSHSDPLTLEDLSSANGTRMAAHRELIKRRPGRYPRRWLGSRLGVTPSSIDTYNRDIPIHRREQFIQIRLYWSNLHAIPDDMEIAGTFLQDETGKRYPARRPLAAKLLRQGHAVTYMRQDANYYWYGEEGLRETIVQSTEYRVQSEKEGLRTEDLGLREKMKPVASERRGLTQKDGADAGTRTIASAQSLSVRTDSELATESRAVQLNIGIENGLPARPKPAKPKRAPTGRRRLKDEGLERLAAQVYDRVNRRSPDPALHIGMAAARKLVSQYPRTLIEEALRLMETRRNIERPAGFLIIVLRSEAKREAMTKR